MRWRSTPPSARPGPGGLGHVRGGGRGRPPYRHPAGGHGSGSRAGRIAREYVTGFALTFEIGVPALLGARREGLTWTDAAVETYLALLESGADTHIARKLGVEEAEMVSAEGSRGARGGRNPVVCRPQGPGRSWIGSCATRVTAGIPGATADLTCAALFVVILEGGWDR